MRASRYSSNFCAAPSIASAVDVSVDGEYLYQFQTGSLDFADSHEDSHQQRVRLGLTFSASEHLSGYFQTESVWEWGSNDDTGGSGTAFDGAAVNVNMRQAYIDWMVPGTSVKVRMGRHAYDLPSFTSTSSMIADMVGDGIVVDMPFGSYQGNELEGLSSAIRIMKESHADALKLEGGEEIIPTVKRIISAGIPVMGHLGLMPQSINKYGTYTVRAKEEAEAEKLVRDAHLLEEAGCFAIVLEKIPAELATRVASELTIPIIGIGAGGGVDGQVLVVTDMLGMTNGFRPRFLRLYADLSEVMTSAIGRYVEDVKSCDFPNAKEQY